jgi:two-component sensor histidine kinase
MSIALHTDNPHLGLPDVLITPELTRRRPRPPNYAAENRTLVALAREMATAPERLPQRLVEMAIELCQAGSAGISVLKADTAGEYFYWEALAGVYAPHVGGRTPRDFSPCGTAVDCHAPQLFSYPARYFTYLAAVEPAITEALVIPFYASGRPLGAIWILAHDAERHFDAEDVRLMTSLAEFTGAALQVLSALGAETQANQALRESQRQLQVSLHDKEVLLKEIHHRVKNNLQMVASLLALQSSQITDLKAQRLFQDSQDRVRSLALLHDTLYQAGSLGQFNFAAYVKAISTQLLTTYATNTSAIRLSTQLDEVPLDLDAAIPCGLILNELLTNVLKHAFPNGQGGEVRLTLRAEADRVTLSLRDTGVGFPTDLDFRQTDSLGLQLVNLLTEQLGGTLTLERGSGTTFTLSFPARCAEPSSASQ